MRSFHFEPEDSNSFRSMPEVSPESGRVLHGHRPVGREASVTAGTSYLEDFSTVGVDRATVGPGVTGTVPSMAAPGGSENRLYRLFHIYILYIRAMRPVAQEVQCKR